MNRLLLALLICAACKHSTSSSSTSHTETQTVTDTQTSESGATTTTTVVTEAPGETTTTIDEYGPPENMREPISPDPALTPHGTEGGHTPPDGVSDGLSAGHARTSDVPRHGPLVKRTVTVTKSGGEVTQTRQEATSQATGASETKAAGKVDTQAQAQTASAPSAGCVGASWIWGLAVLVGVGGAIWFAVRMRRAIP